MKVSQQGLSLIKEFEGCKLAAYLCPAKVWTIGWGSTQHEDGRPVRQGDTITQAQADALLESKVNNVYAPAVDGMIRPTVSLTQGQFDALVSFAYNCGIGALKRSSLLLTVNANPNDPLIEFKFKQWTKGGGKVLAGLERRRAAEVKLYFSS